MAFVVVASLLEIVEQQLVQPDPSSVHYDRKTIMSVRGSLRLMQAFLDECSGTKTNDHQAKQMLDAWIRDVAIEAESKIESKLRQVHLVANKGECEIIACEGLNQILQQVDQTLQYVVKDVELLEFRISTQKTSTTSLVMVGSTSKSSLKPENEMIVGFAKDEGMILKSLMNKRLLKRDIILFVGEGGIGKTTLAKRVYEDPVTTTHFDIRAWVVVSQYGNLKELLVGLLGRILLIITSEISKKDESQLAELLCRSLMGRRYLMVLDNMQSVASWDAIQGCFPDNINGSRILITTRSIEVARYSSVDPHFMKYQTLEASWALFVRKVFGNGKYNYWRRSENLTFGNSQVPVDLLSQIILQCHGLPLAIVVIAGLLATVKESLEIWEDVAKTLDKIDEIGNRVSKILSLSYIYLPSHLKACFLYFGVFPEDSEIPVKKLIKMWVAEGFLKSKKNESLEEVGESYLHNLINRSLVQINELSTCGKVKSCKIHERLHEICVREAKGENILCVINENHAPEASRRWISCQSSHWPITRASYGNHTSNEIHSILYYGEESHLSKCRLVYPCLKLLRVLDLSLINYSYGMPSGVVDLINLRFLALSTIGSLHKFRLLKLQSLQTLIVSSWMKGYTLQLPCDILDLPRLRHLHLERRSSQYLPSMVRKNLQTLFWLKVANNDQKPNFRMVPNLKELGIYIEGEVVPSCLESLVYLRLLEKLKFDVGRVERFYLPIAFPPNLKKLTLCYTYLPWKDIDVISKLPNLEVLKLKDFALCGHIWEPMEGGFRGLKVLLIAHSAIKCWNASADHFPILERLVLRYCWEMKKLPIAFANVRTLKSIVLESCYSSLVNSAKRISSTNMLLFQKMADDVLRVNHLGTKVELPNNESSEDESVDSFEEENEEKVEGETALQCVENSDEERLKAQKNVLKELKRKVSKAIRRN